MLLVTRIALSNGVWLTEEEEDITDEGEMVRAWSQSFRERSSGCTE